MAAPELDAGATGARLLQYTLPNGLQILGQQMPDLESISACFHVRTGARDEADPRLFGVSHFLEHMVFKGTRRRDAEAITLAFNNMGAEFNAFTSNEQTVFYARVLGEYLPQAVDLLSDMMRPRLDAQDFAMERNVILEEIARSEDVPTSQAYRKLLQTYFSGHALGHEVLGTRESIHDLTVEQMRAYLTRRYVANNLIFAIAGNFRWQEVLDLVAEHCGAWQPGDAGRDALPHLPERSAAQVYVKPQLQQQIVLLAWPSLSYEDPDLYAAELAAMVLGDGTGSRLFWNIFQKGLAETAVASLSAFDHTGMMVAYTSTTPDHAPGVLALIQAELKAMQEDGPHEDELRRAKDKLISHVVLDGESAYSRMQDLAYTWVAEHRLRTIEDEVAEVEKVQLSDVRRVLDRFPYTAHQVLTAYGPLDSAALGVEGHDIREEEKQAPEDAGSQTS